MVYEAPPPHTFWQCQRCTACCRWPGDVKVDAPEITAIAAFLKMPEEVFLEKFTRLRTNRTGLSLIEQADDSCIFLKGNDCLINEVKPQQCRDFPNKWNFPGWRQVCHAIPVTVEAAIA
jgi:Fe-S-cluster containining protein